MKTIMMATKEIAGGIQDYNFRSYFVRRLDEVSLPIINRI